ncbi:hypothetical protein METBISCDRAFT_25877 [Metschnikowia bicuspidata]|uniref:Major facilitator superfamily (MFS) profile domain-containing protein n=1 Tax=Metschnikowia bicuspidata TaxID=27322 RepID=A0A4P9ZHA6_9ASCO|nr:hypothetical protein METBISCDRAFT_25877 [Metschnikowia bicuspidata]
MSPLMGVLSHCFLKRRGMALTVASAGSLVRSTVFAVILIKFYIQLEFKWALRILAFSNLSSMALSVVLINERPVFHGNQKQTRDMHEPYIVEVSLLNSDSAQSIITLANTENVTSLTPQAPKKEWWWSDLANFFLFVDTKFIALALATFAADVNSLTVLTYLASFVLSFGVQEQKA